jgi:hypothetical protein
VKPWQMPLVLSFTSTAIDGSLKSLTLGNGSDDRAAQFFSFGSTHV